MEKDFCTKMWCDKKHSKRMGGPRVFRKNLIGYDERQTNLNQDKLIE